MNKNLKIKRVGLIGLILALALALALPAAAQARQAALPDATIKTIIETRLINDGLLKEGNVAVSVADGVVTLTGKVRSLAEKLRAGEAVQGVDSVVRLDNNLTIESEPRSDNAIAGDIGQAIRSYALFDIFDWVDGRVVDGRVVLTGYAREPWRKDEYGRRVAAVAGVQALDNQIQVLPLSNFDDQLRAAVARAIYGNSLFQRYANSALPPIHIVVLNGRVILKGVVATNLERTQAELLARSRGMAFEVVNELVLEKEMKR
jgi:osmotically-inducible protein OsmY